MHPQNQFSSNLAQKNRKEIEKCVKKKSRNFEIVLTKYASSNQATETTQTQIPSVSVKAPHLARPPSSLHRRAFDLDSFYKDSFLAKMHQNQREKFKLLNERFPLQGKRLKQAEVYNSINQHDM
jgi:hypothetical protein